MARGVDGRTIFHDDHDRRLFLLVLRQVREETRSDVVAYCLMDNHFHLAIRVGEVPLSRVVQRLLTRYAKSFNRKYDRKGHLFQDRFKSILCLDDRYLLGLIRYIHANPVRAGLVSSPSDWRWSSRRDHPDLEDFASGADFDPWLQAHTKPVLMRIETERPRSLDEIAVSVAARTRIPMAMIRSENRERIASAARKAIVHTALDCGYSISEISRWLRRTPGTIHALAYGRNNQKTQKPDTVDRLEIPGRS